MAYYSIQGIQLTDLAQQFGTPLYVYDADKIREKISVLRGSLKGFPLSIKYACKANTNLSVLRIMLQNGVDLDVVSPQELALGILAGYAGNQITFTPSGVDFSEIEFAVGKGAIVNLDNLSVLEKFGQKYGSTKPCLIRIKPHVFGGGNEKIMTAHPESKFGISIHQKEEILTKTLKSQLNSGTFKFLMVLVKRDRINLLSSVIINYLELVYKTASVKMIEVSTAFPFTTLQKLNLIKKLKELTNAREIRLVVTVDSSLIGGFLIKTNSKVIDFTIKNQLENLAKHLNGVLEI